jgi:glycosyltransferase involved in cell wall biosynthesis
MPRVSVIIPNYNHATYLKQRIDSVLDQTYQNFELIILDDCSTDNSREIIESYRHHQKVSQIVYNETNSGTTFKQWNKGVALAKGEIIWIAESDDKAEPEFLTTLVQVLENNPNVGIAYANSYFIDEKDKVLRTYIDEFASWSDRWQQDFINTGKNEVVNYMRFSTVILNASSCIFRKAIFEKAGGCDEKFNLTGDWLIYVKMLEHADLAYCSRPLNYFRCHAQTVRSNTKQYVGFYEKIKMLSYIYENFSVPAKEKKAQAYALLAEFSQASSDFTAAQKASVMKYLRNNFMKNIHLLHWKFKTSVLAKKIISPKKN